MTNTEPPPPAALDDPPDLGTLLHAVRVLLWDLGQHLDDTRHGDRSDLSLRCGAVRRAVIRAIRERGGGE